MLLISLWRTCLDIQVWYRKRSAWHTWSMSLWPSLMHEDTVSVFLCGHTPQMQTHTGSTGKKHASGVSYVSCTNGCGLNAAWASTITEKHIIILNRDSHQRQGQRPRLSLSWVLWCMACGKQFKTNVGISSCAVSTREACVFNEDSKAENVFVILFF